MPGGLESLSDVAELAASLGVLAIPGTDLSYLGRLDAAG